jgi:hypothetical protein
LKKDKSRECDRSQANPTQHQCQWLQFFKSNFIKKDGAAKLLF